MNQSRDERQGDLRGQILEVLNEYFTSPDLASRFPFFGHSHNGVDSLRLQKKNFQGQDRYPNQHVENFDLTTSDQFLITPGFTPQMVLFNGGAKESVSNIYILSTGVAGMLAAPEGNCNFFTHGASLGVGKSIYHLGGNADCYCYVSAWNVDSVEITHIVPANYTLYGNFLVLG